MEVYRISREKHADKLTGSLQKNRWNLDGQGVIYAGSSRALSSLEVLVHLNFTRPDYVQKVVVIHLPDDADYYRIVRTDELPAEHEWRFYSAYPALQKIGSDWYNSKESLILQVPSAVITTEYNFVINVQHPDFRKVKIVDTEEYFWDDRLFPGKRPL